MASSKTPFHEQIATRLIKQLEEGTAPWQKAWEPGSAEHVLPYNPTTGNRYKGVNSIQLQAQERSDPRWMTYKQAQSVDAQVRKGEKGTSIQFWKFEEERTIRGSDGGKAKERIKLDRPRVFFSSVFNAEQIEDLPALDRPKVTSHQWERIERAEALLRASGADVRHEDQSRAYYSPSGDYIKLPQQSQFKSPEGYYATAVHELGHWTGHPSRLDRDLAHSFGTEGYAREELRAEIASLIVGSELNLGHDPNQHAAYVGSWIKALRSDPLEIVRASADAEKISKFVLAFDRSKVVAVAREQNVNDSPDQQRAVVLKAVAEDVIAQRVDDPKDRARLSAAIQAQLDERVRQGRVPAVSVRRDRERLNEQEPKPKKTPELTQ